VLRKHGRSDFFGGVGLGAVRQKHRSSVPRYLGSAAPCQSSIEGRDQHDCSFQAGIAASGRQVVPVVFVSARQSHPGDADRPPDLPILIGMERPKVGIRLGPEAPSRSYQGENTLASL